MSAERETREARLVEAFLARDDDALAAVTTDEEARLAGELRALAAALAPPRGAPAALVRHTLRRARGELVASRRAGPVLRELARVVVATALPLALVLAWNAAVLWLGPGLLEPWLPGALPQLLPAAYVFGSAGWLALLYGSLPALAHIEVARRHREALA